MDTPLPSNLLLATDIAAPAYASWGFAPTPEQQQAITTFDRPVLVLSPAGTGKTTVLALKYAEAVTRWGHGAVLAITFTNKAANEIIARLSRLGCPTAWQPGDDPATIGMPTAGTFNRAAAQILELAAAQGLYTGPTLQASDEDLAQAIALTTLNHPDSGANHGQTGSNPLRRDLDRCKSQGYLPLREGYDHPTRGFAELVEGLPNPGCSVHSAMVAYQEHLQAAHLLDHDDALIQATLMLRQHRDRLLPTLKAVIVDEFQDVNEINRLMLEALAADRHLTALGDDDQAIFGFRGASIRHIQRFPLDHPEAVVVALQTNYRSAAGITSVAQRLVESLPGRLLRATVTNPQPDEALPVTIHPYVSRRPGYNPMSLGFEAGLATFTAETCIRILSEDRARADLVVLVRANDHANQIKDALTKAGQPARISNPNALQSFQLRALIAWLRLLEQPAGQGPLYDLAATTASNPTLANLAHIARQDGRPLIDLLVERCASRQLRNDRLADIATRYRQLRDMQSQVSNATLVDAICKIVIDGPLGTTDQTRLDHFWRAYAAILPGLQEGGSLRAAMLTLQHSLSDDDLASQEDAIEISSVHAFKGREKKLVLLAALADGIFPNRMTVNLGINDKHYAEERRLAYVALSRAREHLHLISVDGARSGLLDLALNRSSKSIAAGATAQ